jgi:hypothetical protein
MNEKPPDGAANLTNTTLQDSLNATYAEIAAVLRHYGVPRTTNLYEVEIPGIVFDIAVGAGWLPLIPPPDDTTPESSRVHGRKLVQLGEFQVERWYVDAFMNLLLEEIAFTTVLPDRNREEQFANLPKFTSTKERETLIQDFREKYKVGGKQPKMIEIANWSGTDYADFKKWRKGRLLDSSSKSKHIAMLLRYNDRSWAKRPNLSKQ